MAPSPTVAAHRAPTAADARGSRLRTAAVGRMLTAAVPNPPPTRQPPGTQDLGDRLARMAVLALLAGVAWGTIAGAVTIARAIGAWMAR